jgi:uncharacterized protein (TIGR02466 family)
MEKGSIIPIFATPLLIHKLNRELTIEETACLLDYRDKTIGNMGNDTTHDLYVLEHPNFANLKKFCEDALADYLDQIYDPINAGNVRLTVTQSWLNYTEKGHNHHAHWHHNSVVSGCLYLNAVRDIDNIVFSKDKEMNWQIQGKSQNAFNAIDTYVSIDKGDLVMFPSHLTHSVPKTKGDHTRISLAFNSFFEGDIGFIEGGNQGVNFLKNILVNQKQNKPYGDTRG